MNFKLRKAMAEMVETDEKKLEEIVQPTMDFNDGIKHPLVELFEGDIDQIPVLKSVGYARVPNTNQFISYVITSKGKEVIKIDADHPNLQAIAEESAKISFVQNFMNGETEE